MKDLCGPCLKESNIVHPIPVEGTGVAIFILHGVVVPFLSAGSQEVIKELRKTRRKLAKLVCIDPSKVLLPKQGKPMLILMTAVLQLAISTLVVDTTTGM